MCYVTRVMRKHTQKTCRFNALVECFVVAYLQKLEHYQRLVVVVVAALVPVADALLDVPAAVFVVGLAAVAWLLVLVVVAVVVADSVRPAAVALADTVVAVVFAVVVVPADTVVVALADIVVAVLADNVAVAHPPFDILD